MSSSNPNSEQSKVRRMSGESPQLPPETVETVEEINFDGPNDLFHPHNWPRAKKLSFIAIVSAKIFVVSFASSIFGSGTAVLVEEYNAANVVVLLGVSLFVAGFAVGPLFFGPVSEVVGHTPPMIFGCLVCAILQIPLALAKNMPVILVCRFLAGVSGSAVLGVGSGMVAELYEPVPRAVALGFSASMINVGSTVAPVAGGYIVDRYGWRWTAWITRFMFLVLEPFACFALRESSPRQILKARAKKLRRRGHGEKRIVAPADLEVVDTRQLFAKYLTKPVRLFCHEPILIFLTVHLTFVYGTLYLAYQLVPLALQRRGWSVTSSNLPFVAMTLGTLTAPFIMAAFTLTWYKKQLFRRGGVTVPEDRLYPMIVGAAILPVSLLWFGWSMSTHWFCQVLAAYFIGVSVLLIFLSGIIYIVDVYHECANSAISIHVAFRSVFAASFPIWTGPFYDALGVEKMSSVLAAVAAILFPVPIVFLIFGKKIRSWSRFINQSQPNS
ncbi:hypothetical protein FSARC_344 [Fusarium sarcochroum]|uniref:Major facilitator superfamily (MFS) profile domain-containing protein n=1 Tax=Fusarium sarcochroum TaxID=1208366 RepID=A0A8H4XGH7_9HYPO|nr:hypothetical protein FSARC_344 [Fusarium sarcochroum]